MAHKLYSKLVFMQSARRHKIGIAHSKFVIEMYEYEILLVHNDGRKELKWVGVDTADRELEIIGVLEDSVLKIKHVMPTIYRRKR